MNIEEYHNDSLAGSEDDLDDDELYCEEHPNLECFDRDTLLLEQRRNRECKRCKANNYDDYTGTIKPAVFSDVPKLMEIACVSIAATLWNHVNVTRALFHVSRRCARNSPKWISLFDKVVGLVDELSVSPSLAKDIKNHVRMLGNEITDWVSYHFRSVFLKHGQDKHVYSLIYHIILHPNGAIDCRETARNMSTSPRLSEVEKFKFFATYCLENEMVQMSPLVLMNNFLDFVNFSEHPLMYYWYCYFKNQLFKIPVPESLSIDSFMFRHAKVDNWPSKEYFFDRLSSDDQVRQAIWLIDKHAITYQKLILDKLNETQRLLVHMERPIKIASYYARSGCNWRDLLATWYEIRNSIDEDQFVKIFKELLKASTIDTVLSEIWTSASSNFKTRVLNNDNHGIVENVLNAWKWANESEFIFTMLQDADLNTRQRIIRMKFFTDHCDELLSNNNLSIMNRLIKLCLPNVEEAFEFKCNLAINSKCVKDKCLTFYSAGNIEGLNGFLAELLSTDHVIRYKKDFLMSSLGIFNGIIARFYRTNVNSAVIFAVWFDIRDLITREQFVLVFDALLKGSIDDTIPTTVWNTACDDFKHHLLNQQRHIIGEVLQSRDCNELFFAMLRDANVDTKRSITKLQFFRNHCEKLLSNGNSSEFNRCLNLCLPEAQELLLFKYDIVTNSDYVKDRCLSFYTSGKLDDMNNYLSQLLTPDLVIQFKRHVLSQSAGFLKDLISRFEKTTTSTSDIFITWYDIRSLISLDQFLLVYGSLFDTKFRDFVSGCDLLFAMLLDENSGIIKEITAKNFFYNYCEYLLLKQNIPVLDRLTNFCLPDTQELAQFKQILLVNSPHVKETSLKFYSTGNTKGLNDYLKYFSSPYPHVVAEFKKSLLTSPEGFIVCCNLIDLEQHNLLNVVIVDGLTDVNAAVAFKKLLLSSQSVVSKLRTLIMSGRLASVQICIDRHLTSIEDIVALKKKLVVSPSNMIRKLLDKFDESYCQAVLLWYFGNENAVQEFKRLMHVDTIFVDLLKECIFEKFDRLLTNCKFKPLMYVRFDIVDRFLNWYFQSSAAVKEYKMKRIYFHQQIDVFSTLLKAKKCSLHLKETVKWFLQNDVAEMEKFRSNNRFLKIRELTGLI
ncbi:uncharacterized protein LOC135849001 [Planococcus citri]|uniref:uncharacterized protein LOC135849001 n=1 Tax=Planococcus citri TaxID=170843 RepID=UPI0031F9048E